MPLPELPLACAAKGGAEAMTDKRPPAQAERLHALDLVRLSETATTTGGRPTVR